MDTTVVSTATRFACGRGRPPNGAGGEPDSRYESPFLTKEEMANHLKISVRYLEMLVAAKRLPVCRLSTRCIRFHRQRVEEALLRYEVKAICLN